MKYIVILGDGMADLPSSNLGGMTPLEVAYKPNIDSLAQKSICGMCKTVPDGIKPGSDVANLSVMGYSPLKYYSGRSPLEALSIGVNMADDDLAVRCNLVTLSEEENYADKSMVDYSAGEISTEEAAELIKAVQEALGNEEFSFYNGVSYRHCLIKHNGECGTEYTPPHDISGKVIGDYLPKGLYGEQMLELMVASYDILKNHPINLKRIEEGKNPANSIWLWGEGSRPALPNFEELRGLKGAVISAVDLLKGIGIAGGMDIIEVEGVTGTVNTNFSGKAEACVKAIRDGYDYVYLHMEAPDECGHQGDSKGKVKSIELIDEKVVGYILNELEGEDIRILVCPDHPTPLVTKTHSSEPIPFIIYDSTSIKEGVFAYTENECAKTGLMLNSGDELVELFLQKEDVMSKEIENEDLAIADSYDNNEDDVVTDNEEVTSDNEEEVADNENNDYQDGLDEQKVIVGDDIFVDDSQNDEENPAKIDPNEESKEDNGEENSKTKDNNKSKNKVGKSSKNKKLITILISVAVLAVLILVSVLTPILVINAPKVLISSAEDFSKPVKDKKELYYLQKDVTVEGDLTLGLNVDLNKKTLIVNGTLTLESPKGDEMTLGVKNGKTYDIGGKIQAKKVVVKNAAKVSILTNVTTDEFEINSVAQGVVNGGLHTNKAFNVKSSKVTFDSLEFGEQITTLNAINSDIVLNKEARINLELQNTKVRAISNVGNCNLDEFSELRLLGATYNNFDDNNKELGTITGGKLVYVSENGAFAKIENTDTVWVSKESLLNKDSEIVNVKNENYIDWLETPQFAVITRDGNIATLELSSVDKAAKKVLVTIDNAEKPIVFDIEKDNISTDNGYVYNLGDKLNQVGNHSIKIVLQSNEPEFIRDSDPYYTQHTHYITLDKVGSPKVSKNEKNEFILTFNAVHFAESYEIVFDGIVLTITNNDKKAGEEIAYNLSGDQKFAALLAVPGNHSIIIVAKSSVEGINSSDKAYAKFPAIMGDLALPQLTIEEDGDNYIISWKKVDNAERYKLTFTSSTDENIKISISTGVTKLVISKEDIAGCDKVAIYAVGGKYYNDSNEFETNLP